MEKELIGPTATLAAAILAKVEDKHSEFTRDVITSAFVDAYQCLKEGIARVETEERLHSHHSKPGVKKISGLG